MRDAEPVGLTRRLLGLPGELDHVAVWQGEIVEILNRSPTQDAANPLLRHTWGEHFTRNEGGPQF